MAKRQGHERGAGAYSRNDVQFTRPRHVDPETGNTRQPKRDLSAAVERVSGMGLSRPVTQGNAVKKYGP